MIFQVHYLILPVTLSVGCRRRKGKKEKEGKEGGAGYTKKEGGEKRQFILIDLLLVKGRIL